MLCLRLYGNSDARTGFLWGKAMLNGKRSRWIGILFSAWPALTACLMPMLGVGVAWAFDVAEVEASVYKVYAFPADRKGYGFGTGFLVSGQRTVITNFHVVEKAAEYSIAFRDKSRRGKLVTARVKADRPELDIAVLEAEEDLPGKPLTLGDYEPEKLANVVTMGFPGAAEIRERAQARTKAELDDMLRDPSGLDATMTSGAVSRMNTADMRKSETRSLHARTVQHNAQFSPGNSGGPLFDECNAVVGINTFLRTDAQGVFFSIHSGELIKTLRDLNISFKSIPKCSPAGASMTMPILIVMSATLALAALVLALRAGSLQQVGAQISRFSRLKRNDLPAASPGRPASAGGNSTPGVVAGGGTASLQPLDGGRALALESGRAMILGRAKTSDLQVENDTVSSRHASLNYNAATGRLVITDLGSSNGTFINGALTTNGQASSGDTLRFGKAEFRLAVTQPAAPRTPQPAAVNSATARGWMLSGFDPSGRAVQLPIRPAAGEQTRTWIIGRDKARAELVVDDSSVSGAHAELIFTAGQGLTLRDLGSTNGTQVDGQGIGTRVVNLKDTGQEVTFGVAKLRLSRILA